MSHRTLAARLRSISPPRRGRVDGVPRVWTSFTAVIILIRHGQSTTNELGLLVGRSNPPLTDMGREQARRPSAHLNDVREVWSSPLDRALTTARIALGHLEPVIKE